MPVKSDAEICNYKGNRQWPTRGIGNGPPRGIGNGPGNRLGRSPVFLGNGKSLEDNKKTKVLAYIFAPKPNLKT